MFPIRDHNPSQRVPYVTYTLMAINILIFAWGFLALQDAASQNAFYRTYAMIPQLISQGENYPSLVTSIFLHGGIMHLAGNMLFLWIFGDNLEDDMGHVPYLIFYLACGVGAGLAQWASGPSSPIPTIGASGAIAGVMGGYLLLYPKAKVDVFIFFIVIIRIIPIPAWIMLGLWFAMQLFNSFGANPLEGGVAYWAHAGGFIIGVVFTLPLWLRKGAGGYWEATDGHPPHPEATYPFQKSRIPKVTRDR